MVCFIIYILQILGIEEKCDFSKAQRYRGVEQGFKLKYSITKTYALNTLDFISSLNYTDSSFML